MLPLNLIFLSQELELGASQLRFLNAFWLLQVVCDPMNPCVLQTLSLSRQVKHVSEPLLGYLSRPQSQQLKLLPLLIFPELDTPYH